MKGDAICFLHGEYDSHAIDPNYVSFTCPWCERAAKENTELEAWWRVQAEREIEQTIAKSASYGGDNLLMMGDVLLALLPTQTISNLIEQGVNADELAIATYVLTKITRIFGAYKAGVRPSDDSWFDLHVYAAMGIRAREKGGWPNGR